MRVAEVLREIHGKLTSENFDSAQILQQYYSSILKGELILVAPDYLYEKNKAKALSSLAGIVGATVDYRPRKEQMTVIYDLKKPINRIYKFSTNP